MFGPAGRTSRISSSFIIASRIRTWLRVTDVVRGYVNLQADTLDTAAELAKGCPILLHGGMVEIRPFWEGVPGMT
jgi:hypothetical protein